MGQDTGALLTAQGSKGGLEKPPVSATCCGGLSSGGGGLRDGTGEQMAGEQVARRQRGNHTPCFLHQYTFLSGQPERARSV